MSFNLVCLAFIFTVAWAKVGFFVALAVILALLLMMPFQPRSP